MKMISKMAKPPKNGARMVVFLTEVDFSNSFHWKDLPQVG